MEAAVRILDDPESAPQVYDLYAGPDLKTPTTYDLHLTARSNDKSSIALDPERLDHAVTYNCFGPVSPQEADFIVKPHASQLDTPTALFCQSSLINHACLYNSVWTCFNDFQTIRALVKIKKGQAITLSYAVDGDYDIRAKLLKKHLPCPCRCDLCLADLHDGEKQLLERKKLVAEANDTRDTRQVNQASSASSIRKAIRETMQLYQALEKTYSPDRTVMRHELSPIAISLGFLHGCLAIASQSSSPYKDVIKWQKLAIEHLGVEIGEMAKEGFVKSAPRASQHVAIMSVIQMASAYFAMGQRIQAKSWLKEAVKLHEWTVGGDKALFLKRFRTVLSTIGILELLS